MSLNPLTRNCLLALLCLPALAIHEGCDLVAEDDAYIIFRYVENVFAGHGPVYNPGERICGVTTPLYLGWLVLVKALTGGDVVSLAIRGNVLFFALTVWGLASLVRTITRSDIAAMCAAGFFALFPNMNYISISGMESAMFSALMVWALALAVQERPLAACIVGGLSIACRPEGVFVAAALLPLLPWRDLRVITKCALAGALPVLIWILFAAVYYGTPVPHSVVAKSQPLYPQAPGTVLNICLNTVAGWGGATLGGWIGYLISALSIIAAVVLLRSREARARGLTLVLLPVLMFGFYIVGNPKMFMWYWMHLFISLLILLICGWHAAATMLRERMAGKGDTLARAWCALGLIWLIVLLGVNWSLVSRGTGSLMALHRDVAPYPQRVVTYRQVAGYLSGHLKDGDVVAAPEIGSFGYYLEGKVLDTCGLVSPEAIPFLPVPEEERYSDGSVSTALIQKELPEYIVSMPGFIRNSLFKSDWFHATYGIMKVQPMARPIDQVNKDVIIFARKNVDGGQP